MKRLILIAVAIAAAGGFVLLSTGASEEKGAKFTVELDNAFGLISGGDFKVAGVTAGKIEGLRVHPKTHRALVDFSINVTGFGSLRKDVECQVLPQSLVGEYYVDCAPGKSPEKLEPGTIIPVERTSSTVPPDLVGNIMRRPVRERLRLVIGELGAAVAGNGENLNAAIRRASPALRETNRVLAILARQNKVLADLTKNADTFIGELADGRKDISRWVDESRDIARISAERDDEIAAGFRRLPTFLRELRPTMAQLSEVAEAQEPALRTLAASSGQLQRLFDNLPPFAEATRPALRSLGEASQVGRTTMLQLRPTVRELQKYTEVAPETSQNEAIILEHLDKREHGIEEDPRSPGGKGYTGWEALLQYIFDQNMSTNIHDGNVHMLKVNPFEGECAPYSDIKAFEEHGKQCGRLLGPNPVGIVSRDPSQPPGWDRADRGFENQDTNNRRRAVLRAARERHGEPLAMPKADDVLPSGPEATSRSAPEPPLVSRLPEVDTPVRAPEVPGSAEPEQGQLLDFLLGS
jgi:virulence factor Mce-like protein